MASIRIKNHHSMRQTSRFNARDMTRVAFNYIAPVDVEACTVKRKGKIIKGERPKPILPRSTRNGACR